MHSVQNEVIPWQLGEPDGLPGWKQENKDVYSQEPSCGGSGTYRTVNNTPDLGSKTSSKYQLKVLSIVTVLEHQRQNLGREQIRK
jgi:hypothetical protein